MIRPYETFVIFDGNLPEDVTQKEQDQFEKFLKKNCELEKVDVWGKKRLSYEIKKRKFGTYCLFQFQGEGDIPAKIDKHFKLNTNVLRYLTVLRELKDIFPPIGTESPEPSEENNDISDNIAEEGEE